MADSQPLVPLSVARDRAIEELSSRFALDELSLDELDRRLDLAYKARTIPELQQLTADLVPREAGPVTAPVPGDAPVWAAAAGTAPDHDSFVAIMSDSKRQGLWAVPQRLDVLAVMSDATIDLSRAVLPAGIIDIKVRATMSSMKIILPPGVRVASRVGNIMSSVGTDDGVDQAVPAPGAPVIRLSGWALMSDVKITVRRRSD